MLIASWGGRALVRELARQTDQQSTTAYLNLSLNWHVLAFTIGAAVATVLLFGVAPAFRASRVTPMDTLKEGRGTIGGRGIGLSSSLVVSRVALLVGIGAVAGAAASLWLSRFVATLLYGLEPRDPMTLLGAIVVLIAVGLGAGALPATRAARIDPAAVLRES